MKPRSLRGELIRLVGAAVIPVVVFAILVAIWDAFTTRHTVERGLQDTTRALSLALDREVAAWINALNVLSTSPALDAGDLEAFRRQATEVAALYGGWITMIEPSGQQIINTFRTPGEPLPRSNGQYFRGVFETGRPVVSDLFVGAATGQQIVAVFVPVVRGGKVRYSLNLGMTPGRLSALLAGQALPEQWLGLVTDSHFQIVARAHEPERYIGSQAPGWYVEGARSLHSGLLSGPSFQGGAVRLAYERLPMGWSVAVAVPESALAAAWQRPLIAMIGMGLLLIALAIALSFFYARRISESVKRLLSGEGGDPRPIREIEEVRLRLREQGDEQIRRRAAEAATASAEEANRSKDRFLTTLSHELRTPLSVIMGWIAVIRARGGEPGKMEQALQIIERNAMQQAKLIDELLDMSRIVAGKLGVTRKPMDLSQAVNEAIDDVRPAAHEKQIALHARVQPGIPVDGDYLRLVQITNNLLVNAIKFTPKGGRVEVALKRNNGNAELAVRDNGRGIDPKLRPRLFDRFAQGEVHGGYQPGLGLGLPIVRHLTELHGGSVRADSEGPGHGATFTVVVPAASEPQPAADASREERAVPSADLTGLRVLVVDDHDDGRRWVCGLLNAHGATTAEASHAGEALARGEQFHPGAIVSDIAMPLGDGYELIRGLRSRERGRRTPAIALTALAGGEDRERALREGFDAVIAKGSDPAALLAALARLSRASRRPEQPQG